MCTAKYRPCSLLQHKNIHCKFTFTKKQIHQEAGDINKNALVAFTPERLYMITVVFTILFGGTIMEMGTTIFSILVRASRTKINIDI